LSFSVREYDIVVNISSENGVNILKDIKGIQILDISRNSKWVNNNNDTAPYIYPDEEFQYLTQLRSHGYNNSNPFTKEICVPDMSREVKYGNELKNPVSICERLT
jgi:hypothetical protein